MSWAAWSGHHAPLQAQVQAVMDPEGQLAAQLLQFLNTRDGLAWLSGTLDAWEAALSRGPPSFQDLNTLVITKFQEFVASEAGKRAAQQLHKEMSTGTLMVPVFVIEELVKQRLRSIVTTQVRTLARPCFRFFALHVTAASCLMAGAKLLLKGAARKRGRRTYSTLCFITDIALPTSFYGPALGALIAALRLVPARGSAAATQSAPASASQYPGGGRPTLAAMFSTTGPGPPRTPVPSPRRWRLRRTKLA
ncbi:hypothetical protein V8C86DRAFT_2755243 [Haematococcus lacustris]